MMGSLDIAAANTDGCTPFWYENDGLGNFTDHYIQHNYPKERLQHHAIGHINRNGAYRSSRQARNNETGDEKTLGRNLLTIP